MTTAREFAAVIVAPPTAHVDDHDRSDVRDQLLSTLPSIASRLPSGDQVVINMPLLRHVGKESQFDSGPDEEFSWKPLYVRRSLGLATIDACLTRGIATPFEAIERVVDESIAEWCRTGWRTFHWEPWMANLGPGARAAVLAEALTWATGVWTAIEWRNLGERVQLGGPDDQWICPATRTVRLKGRVEARVTIRKPDTVTLVSVSSGLPGVGWESELGYLALVAALRSPSRSVPSRVVGIWPDAQLSRMVDIDNHTLVNTAERVVSCVGAVVDARTTAARSIDDSSPTPSGKPLSADDRS
jgi:hypothetical protein